ncbi:alpha/beta hydrolase [Flavobacterium sp. CBA20B-1]|uniref:alpha/beta hydrolase n=1 Tax=unclassified Flavobacterium TaxID=196869 RepID=UPI002224A8BE|nr:MULTISPECIES: alpha/beta hydrolase-fold protein [unclassified Flavobacterium]WCM41846.1 alpha/beta hydrolase [Flavobacterium sp. CBA20B-1]
MNKIYFLFIIVALFCSCSKTTQPNDPIPAHETIEIQSKSVNEKRIINVWTPEGYSQSKDSLPVMYMADGGIKEDFPHIVNTFAKLIQSKKIPPMILVGIENTERRRDLSGVTEVEKDKEVAPVVGGSEKFRAFISDELFPEIEKKYRTSGKKGILGESLSGLFVMETFFLEPELFDYYIAFDPSLWWNDHYLVKTAKEHLTKIPADSEKKLWFAGSSATDISPYTNELAEILKTENRTNLKWNYADEPKEKHTTIFRATKEKALIWTLGNE